MLFKGCIEKARKKLKGWTIDNVEGADGPEGILLLGLSKDGKQKVMRISASHLEWKVTEERTANELHTADS